MIINSVAITGGAGFIGSNLTKACLQAGWSVVVIDDLSTGSLKNLPRRLRRLTVVQKDVRDLEAEDIAGAQVVFHLAALVDVRRSIAEPALDRSVNYGGTVRAFKVSRAEGAYKFVFASSAAVYGHQRVLPSREGGPCLPISPYGRNKLRSEKFLRAECKRAGPCTPVILRMFNVYGPGQRPHSSYSGVITAFLAAAKNGTPVRIYGSGMQTRDFVYVSDVVDAYILSARKRNLAPTLANVGTGLETSVSHLFERVTRLTGKRIPMVRFPARRGEILRSCAFVEGARQRLGWKPQVRLDEGLSRTWSWLRRQNL